MRFGYAILNFDRAPVPQTPGSNLNEGGDGQKAVTIRGDIDWRPTSRFRLNFQPFRLIRQAAVFNARTFVQTGFSLAASQRILRRLSIGGNIYYSNDDFSGNRRDNRFQTRISLDYRTIKWLGFRLGYIFERRFSNQSNFDMYSNTIAISIQGIL